MSNTRKVTVPNIIGFDPDALNFIKNKMIDAIPAYLDKEILLEYINEVMGKPDTDIEIEITNIICVLQLICLSIARALHYLIKNSNLEYKTDIEDDLKNDFKYPGSSIGIFEIMYSKKHLSKFFTTDKETTRKKCEEMESEYFAVSSVENSIRASKNHYYANQVHKFFQHMEGGEQGETVSNILCMDVDRVAMLKQSIPSLAEDDLYKALYGFIFTSLHAGLYIYSYYKRTYPTIKLRKKWQCKDLFDNNTFDARPFEAVALPSQINLFFDLNLFRARLVYMQRENVAPHEQASIIENCIVLSNKYLRILDSREKIAKDTRMLFATTIGSAIAKIEAKRRFMQSFDAGVCSSMSSLRAANILTTLHSSSSARVKVEDKPLSEVQKKIIVKQFNSIINEFKLQLRTFHASTSTLAKQCDDLIVSFSEFGESEIKSLGKVQSRKMELSDLLKAAEKIDDVNLKFSIDNHALKIKDLATLKDINEKITKIQSDISRLILHCDGLKKCKAKKLKKEKARQLNLKTESLKAQMLLTSEQTAAVMEPEESVISFSDIVLPEEPMLTVKSVSATVADDSVIQEHALTKPTREDKMIECQIPPVKTVTTPISSTRELSTAAATDTFSAPEINLNCDLPAQPALLDKLELQTVQELLPVDNVEIEVDEALVMSVVNFVLDCQDEHDVVTSPSHQAPNIVYSMDEYSAIDPNQEWCYDNSNNYYPDANQYCEEYTNMSGYADPDQDFINYPTHGITSYPVTAAPVNYYTGSSQRFFHHNQMTNIDYNNPHEHPYSQMGAPYYPKLG